MRVQDSTENICTYEDFKEFVWWLVREYDRQPEWWQNMDLERFLVAMGTWDMRSYCKNTGNKFPENANWRALAQHLLAASTYGV